MHCERGTRLAGTSVGGNISFTGYALFRLELYAEWHHEKARWPGDTVKRLSYAGQRRGAEDELAKVEEYGDAGEYEQDDPY